MDLSVLAYNLFFVSGDDCLHRALIRTCSAISTKLWIYYIFVIAFRNRFYWALIFA